MPDRQKRQEIDALLEHRDWVRVLARSLVSDPDVAEEIEQDTWLAAVEKSPDEVNSPRAWLSIVVRNLSRMHWRSRASQQRRDAAGGERRWEDATARAGDLEPDSVSLRTEALRQLSTALAGLPEPYDTILFLRFYEGLAIRDIARRLEIPRSTTMTRLQRGIELLRKRLETSGGRDWRSHCALLVVPLHGAARSGAVQIVAIMTKIKITVIVLTLGVLLALVSRSLNQSGVAERREYSAAAAELRAPADVPDETGTSDMRDVQRTSAEQELVTSEGNSGLGASFHVLVRHAESLEPVPFAEILFLDHGSTGSAKTNMSQPEDLLDIEESLLRNGVVRKTDASGVIRLPSPTGAIEIGARSIGEFGYLRLSAEQLSRSEPAEILLWPIRHQRVIVVEEDGQPAEGVAVSFSPNRHLGYGYPSLVGHTDRNGVVEFRHLEALMPFDEDQQCSFGVLVPSRDPLVSIRDDEALGRTDLRFVLPATGVVEVLCTEYPGQPVNDGMDVTLRRVLRFSESGSELMAATQTVRTQDGLATFHRVGIDTKLVVQGFSTRAGQAVSTTGAGPSRPGEVVRIELQMPSEVPPLQIHVVNASGDPLANYALKVRMDHEDRQRRWRVRDFGATTSAEGRISLSVDGIASKGAQRVRVLLYSTVISKGVEATSFSLLECDLTTHLRQPEELETVFGQVPIVGGSVVGENGIPLAGQEVHLRLCKPVSAGSFRGPVFATLTARTSESGEFLFRGPLDHGDYFFTLDMDYGNPITFRPGETNLLISNSISPPQEGGRASCRLLLDNPEWARLLRVRAAPRFGQSAGTVEISSVDIEYPNGRFSLDGVSLATDLLQVYQLQGFDSLAELIPDEVSQEHRSDGVHLPDWDLRGRLFEHVIHLSSESRNARTGTVLISRFGEAEMVWEPGEPLVFLATVPVIDLEIRVDYHRPVVCKSTGDTQVLLKQGLPVCLGLPQHVQLPEGSIWRISMASRNRAGGGPSFVAVHSFSARSASGSPMMLPVDGIWDITMSFYYYDGWALVPEVERPPVVMESGSVKYSILVKDSEELQAFLIPATDAGLRAALPAR